MDEETNKNRARKTSQFNKRTKSSWTQVAVYRKLNVLNNFGNKFGRDGDTVESSKPLSKGKNRVRGSNTCKKARVKLVEPVEKESTSDKGLERVRSETKAPDGQPKKKVREAERSSSASMPTKPISSQVTEGVKVGILPENYPEVLLTIEPMDSVEETMLEKIIKSGKKKATKPHFHSSHNRPGWVASMCADNTTMQ
ncbi:hypothetical protein JTB14_013711 [Gonioctena quinquepunctata]|nr:hypothetical protein JTB14_013711 [Gonioctena quinquepunctata]